MKKIKYLILISLFLCTGCFGSVGDGYLEKTCTKQETINGIIYNLSIKLEHKDNVILKLVISESYEINNADSNLLEPYKLALKSQNNSYQNDNGIKVTINADNNSLYSYTYTIDPTLVKETNLTRLDIETDYFKMIEKYGKTMTCK